MLEYTTGWVTGRHFCLQGSRPHQSIDQLGHQVKILMTPAATAFITPLTLQVLSKQAVLVEVLTTLIQNKSTTWGRVWSFSSRSLQVPIPLQIGPRLTDNINASTLALREVKRFLAPIWIPRCGPPATQNNLEAADYQIIPPREALLACGDQGSGALASIETSLTIQGPLNENLLHPLHNFYLPLS